MPQNASSLIDVVSDISELSNTAGEVAQSLPGIAAAARGFCRVMAGTPGGRLLQAIDIGNVCAPFWAEDEIAPPTESPPSFPGGQCPVPYIVDYEYYDPRNDRNIDGSQTVWGPLGNISVVTGEEAGADPVHYALVGSGGPILSGGGAGNIDRFLVQTPGRVALGEAPTIVSITATPRDDDPDNCGSPPPQFEPSPDWDGSGVGDPQVITGPDGKDYNITVGPFDLGPDGELNIPIEVGDIAINLGNGGGAGGQPSGAGPEVDGGEGGEQDIPPAPDGQRCVAVIFRFSGFPTGMGRVLGGSENVRYYKVFGNADVYAESDDGVGEWVGNVDLQSGQIVVGVPATGLTITKARANLQAGITYSAIPIYADI